MGLSDVVQVSITATSAFPTLPGFGEPMIASFEAVAIQSALVQEYGSLTSLVTGGFATSTATYKCAAKVWSNNPSVPALKVGKRTTSQFTQKLQLTAVNATANAIFNFSVGGVPFTYTVPGSSSNNATAAALTTLINTAAISGVTATNPGSPSANVLLTMTAGLLVDVVQDAVNMSFLDQTTFTATHLATDLTAINTFDNNWYGLLLDSNSSSEILEAAAWAESNGLHMFVTNGSDTVVKSAPGGDTTSVLHALLTAAYTRTVYLHSQSQLLSYSGAAWMGKQFTTVPGSDNWAWKTLNGVTVDNLNDGEVANIKTKNGNVYTSLASVNVTRWGKVPSGQWADVIRFIDWLQVNLQIAIFTLLANNSKLPYTDAGLDAIRSAMKGVFEQAIKNGGLAATPAYVINIPLVASISPTDRGNRNVPGIAFSATLAGAVNSVQISGTVSF